ncbi:MAG: hypothetical protein A3H69_02945 [Candidatus Sungbacteria bacterium RIFCSPLOWO2_02_FULL_47_9]|uniref:ABC transporter domain-containing protein n=1 Tax=Candidatus Sungbacteria bacterium RIFCSPHIGHO2_01_FULL_47_32 TaxID=1802264 RepID=A0A1G2K876_9BACT|nr:MAG: hypothetical protein UX72_C0007G0033 [Parcubacteria group bacterium GW2011_GWA2_47_10]OGZ95565.1 MAG: hypothetical protein A2633_06530 [Candidatus Sungbacteria bacterium RIFCSPHIGHO2_01_FULL_47_32]OGZ99280.1 MAG: hypothetical protein A3D57_05455 [Candidatus Sungbacteria bacterium RIFCSPHIGHO2_02_FULL_46_12]OHA06339.1 MAG: hypothetical protein A3A28_04710 [Candidatus Sungbacteria bacterium RIFCSPLOWO2_01_FULL_47_32]OHA11339.1 MAG: hypothetical protein A3H69_02945 [Candidatus Sungbacteria
MLSIKNLTKKFEGVTAVNNLTVEVKEGEIYSLIGPNGSGKTTTVKSITGLYQPTSGDISIGGFSVIREPERAKSVIGYIPDDPFVYERITGREFLHLVGSLFGMNESQRNEKIKELIGVFSIEPLIDGFVDNYSRGNKQKLSILAAFLHSPKLLVVDEPIVGLDPESAIATRELFSGFAKKGGSVFLCTHTLSFAEAISSRVGLLQEGALVREGTLSELRKAANLSHGTLEELYLHFTQKK